MEIGLAFTWRVESFSTFEVLDADESPSKVANLRFSGMGEVGWRAESLAWDVPTLLDHSFMAPALRLLSMLRAVMLVRKTSRW